MSDVTQEMSHGQRGAAAAPPPAAAGGTAVSPSTNAMLLVTTDLTDMSDVTQAMLHHVASRPETRFAPSVEQRAHALHIELATVKAHLFSTVHANAALRCELEFVKTDRHRIDAELKAVYAKIAIDAATISPQTCNQLFIIE